MENIIMEIAKGVYEEIGKGIIKLSEDYVRKKEIETDGNVKVAKINGGAKVMTAGTIVAGSALTVTMIVREVRKIACQKKDDKDVM